MAHEVSQFEGAEGEQGRGRGVGGVVGGRMRRSMATRERRRRSGVDAERRREGRERCQGGKERRKDDGGWFTWRRMPLGEKIDDVR
jgi:hypothetical protein